MVQITPVQSDDWPEHLMRFDPRRWRDRGEWIGECLAFAHHNNYRRLPLHQARDQRLPINELPPSCRQKRSEPKGLPR
jgi:hypothetical protein